MSSLVACDDDGFAVVGDDVAVREKKKDKAEWQNLL